MKLCLSLKYACGWTGLWYLCPGLHSASPRPPTGSAPKTSMDPIIALRLQTGVCVTQEKLVSVVDPIWWVSSGQKRHLLRSIQALYGHNPVLWLLLENFMPVCFFVCLLDHFGWWSGKDWVRAIQPDCSCPNLLTCPRYTGNGLWRG